MKVKTSWWGEIDAVYFRDDHGREGLKSVAPLIGNSGGLILPRDLANSAQWDGLLLEAMREKVEQATVAAQASKGVDQRGQKAGGK